MWDQIQEQDQLEAIPARSGDPDCTLAGKGPLQNQTVSYAVMCSIWVLHAYCRSTIS